MAVFENVGFIGFGAIGASFGVPMIKNGINPVVIVDERRLEPYKEAGIYVNGEHFDLNVQTVNHQNTGLDIIIVSVKYNQLKESIELIKPFADEHTIIVSLLNGIDSEDILARHFNPANILHGFVLGIDALRIGNEVTFKNEGTIVFGAGFESAIDKVSKVEELLEANHISYQIPGDIISEQWWKFLVNVGINQVSAVLLGNYKMFQENNYARELMIDTMKEVINVANAEGIGLGENSIQRFLEVLGTLGPDMKTSMLQDVEANRITEVDMLAGKMIELGKKNGVEVPLNQLLYKMLKAIEFRY